MLITYETCPSYYDHSVIGPCACAKCNMLSPLCETIYYSMHLVRCPVDKPYTPPTPLLSHDYSSWVQTCSLGLTGCMINQDDLNQIGFSKDFTAQNNIFSSFSKYQF